MTNRFHEADPQTFASQLVVFPDGTDDHAAIVAAAAEAARSLFDSRYGYKKAGVLFLKIAQRDGFQRALFRDVQADERQERLSRALDSLTSEYGPGTVLFAVQDDGQVKTARERRSPQYTTRWSDIPKASVK